jgi:hypothetical protein
LSSDYYRDCLGHHRMQQSKPRRGGQRLRSAPAPAPARRDLRHHYGMIKFEFFILRMHSFAFLLNCVKLNFHSKMFTGRRSCCPAAACSSRHDHADRRSGGHGQLCYTSPIVSSLRVPSCIPDLKPLRSDQLFDQFSKLNFSKLIQLHAPFIKLSLRNLSFATVLYQRKKSDRACKILQHRGNRITMLPEF